ncbi:hypothetical protein BOX15_Mlig014043g1 [Macrostomum lignano]|nr:hypothetical protein BOX15_Mlig014043g1 [Macrostomum lignano]
MSKTLPTKQSSMSAVRAEDPLSTLLTRLLRQGSTADALKLLDSVRDAGVRAARLADALDCAMRLPRPGAVVASLLSQLLEADNPDQQSEVAATASAAALKFLANLSKNSTALYSVLARLSSGRIVDAFRCCVEAGEEETALRLLPHLPVPPSSTAAQWLMLASERGLLRLLAGLLNSRCLQAAPAVLNAEDARGRTALAAACLAGQAGAARLLLDSGSADPGRVETDGRTCRQLLPAAGAAGENSAAFDEIALLLDTAESLGSSQSERAQSRQLHSFLTRCGFTARRAELHCEAADFLLVRIARPLAAAADRSGQLACHLVGSYAEGWGACLLQANGRLAADSNVNWLLCRGNCEPEREPRTIGDCQQAGISVRTDWQTGRRWQNPHETARIVQLFRGGGGGSARQLMVRQTRDLPACFASQERRLMRCLSTVQGQLFTIVKLVFKRMLPSMGAAGLTSYHAKTVLFFLLARHARRRSWWTVENLLPLVRKTLHLTLELLELDARPCVAMPHFFADNCQLAFRDPSVDTKLRVRESLSALCADPKKVDDFLRKHLRPVVSQRQPLFFHPFTLLPADFFSLELMETPNSDSATNQAFADVYLLVQQCLSDLSSSSQADKQSRLTRISCLPAWCLCSRQCLTALAWLSFGDRTRATKVLVPQTSHRVQRYWDSERCCFFDGLLSKEGAAGGVLYANPSNCGDWGWRFCFSSRGVRVALEELPQFTQALLQPRPDSLDRLYVNFRCISWSLMAELLPKHIVSPANWYAEMKFDPDHQELLTLAHYSDSPLHLHFCRTMLEELRNRSRLDLSCEIEAVQTKLSRLTRGSDGWNGVKLRPKRMGLSSCRS